MDGTYDIDFESGKSERSVSAQNVRLIGAATSGISSSRGALSSTAVGSRPRMGGSPPIVTRSSLASTTSAASAAADGAPAVKFRMGNTVEVRKDGGVRYMKARIVSSRPNDMYDVMFEDGTQEKSVPVRFIRSATAAAARE
eukprot:gene2000-2344_t